MKIVVTEVQSSPALPFGGFRSEVRKNNDELYAVCESHILKVVLDVAYIDAKLLLREEAA